MEIEFSDRNLESIPYTMTHAYNKILPTHVKLLMCGDDSLMNLKFYLERYLIGQKYIYMQIKQKKSFRNKIISKF